MCSYGFKNGEVVLLFLFLSYLQNKQILNKDHFLIYPLTNQIKDYPFEGEITSSLKKVTGVISSDHVKCLDWKEKEAEFISKLTLKVTIEVLKKLNTLKNIAFQKY